MAEHTVTAFAEELLRLSREYVAHFDPGAQTDVFAVRLEATGPHFSLVFDQRGDEGPNLAINLRGVATEVHLAPLPDQPVADDDERGKLWRR